MRHVYVSGPISNAGQLTPSEQQENVEAAIEVGQRLLDAGLAPHLPQLTWYWERWLHNHGVPPNDHSTWLHMDRVFVEAADAVLRLPGNSLGADREVDWAREADIPVYYDPDDLIGAWENTVVIGVTGYMRSGKDSVAAALGEHGFERIALADALKDMAREIGWDGSKWTLDPCDACGMHQGRALLQRLGTEAVRAHIGSDAWVRALRRKLRLGGRYVVPDVRFPDEAQAITGWGGQVWRVVRPGYEGDGHVSEQGMTKIEPDVTITNAGTLVELIETVNTVARMTDLI